MSDTDTTSDSEDSSGEKYRICLEQAKLAFNRRYGDPTSAEFDFEKHRRMLADEKVVKPNASWLKIKDPEIRRHEEIIYRLERSEREVERVTKQMESIQDQLDRINERMTSVETCVNNTQTYLELIIRELRQAQQQQFIMQNEARNINVVE